MCACVCAVHLRTCKIRTVRRSSTSCRGERRWHREEREGRGERGPRGARGQLRGGRLRARSGCKHTQRHTSSRRDKEVSTLKETMAPVLPPAVPRLVALHVSPRWFTDHRSPKRHDPADGRYKQSRHDGGRVSAQSAAAVAQCVAAGVSLFVAFACGFAPRSLALLSTYPTRRTSSKCCCWRLQKTW